MSLRELDESSYYDYVWGASNIERLNCRLKLEAFTTARQAAAEKSSEDYINYLHRTAYPVAERAEMPKEEVKALFAKLNFTAPSTTPPEE